MCHEKWGQYHSLADVLVHALYTMIRNMKKERFHAYYHDIILSLLPLVVYSWYAMNSTKSAAWCMFYKNTRINMQIQLQSRQREKCRKWCKRNRTKWSLTCTLATRRGHHSCNLCWFDVQILLQPSVNQSMNTDATTIASNYKWSSRKGVQTSKAFAPGVLSLTLGGEIRQPTYTCPNPPFPSFLSSL